MSEPFPAVSGAVQGTEAARAGASARGFVVYVALDEAAAAAAGMTLSELAHRVRAHLKGLSPTAQTHVTIAVAPPDAPGSDIGVLRAAPGNPGAARQPRSVPAPAQPLGPAGVLIDLPRREVRLDGETLDLTFKEFEILKYLIDNRSRTVAREELLRVLWRDDGGCPHERTIDSHITRLRAKLERYADSVRTVHGHGYRFHHHLEAVVWTAPEYDI
ncbi:winged helix-turn-helix domain-containing protein [uncultured Arthrobacter sp.]|uniref:winged helix-turn-helix domain-containing protein n=1 Tax=uncultured Arthrobacter sp. TaxID=114050 RepID=UPI0025F005C4|nr:winged helix-turn-helix domain-containing protein [uncultured Arthrobacter sp.]